MTTRLRSLVSTALALAFAVLLLGAHEGAADDGYSDAIIAISGPEAETSAMF
jgi:hypothetical protein